MEENFKLILKKLGMLDKIEADINALMNDNKVTHNELRIIKNELYKLR